MIAWTFRCPQGYGKLICWPRWVFKHLEIHTFKVQVTGATDGWLGMGFSEGSSVSMIGGSGGGSDTFICSELEVKRYWYLGRCVFPMFFPCFFVVDGVFLHGQLGWKTETLRITSYSVPSGGVPWRFHTMSTWFFWLKDYDISTWHFNKIWPPAYLCISVCYRHMIFSQDETAIHGYNPYLAPLHLR